MCSLFTNVILGELKIKKRLAHSRTLIAFYKDISLLDYSLSAMAALTPLKIIRSKSNIPVFILLYVHEEIKYIKNLYSEKTTMLT